MLPPPPSSSPTVTLFPHTTLFRSASKLLVIFTAIASLLCLYIIFVGGVSAGFVALSIGLFNSIMFPVIFTLTLERSTARAEATSGLLCTAIVGGAAIPYLVGQLSDAVGYAAALALPARKSVVQGKSVSVRVDLGGRRLLKKKKKTH